VHSSGPNIEGEGLAYDLAISAGGEPSRKSPHPNLLLTKIWESAGQPTVATSPVTDCWDANASAG